MIKMSRKAKKAMAVALTAGMLASTAATPVMAATQGWKQNSKGWWYQNADGSYPANKWSKINGVWYYFDANGYMLANSWVKDSQGKWYFVGENGAMKINSWAKDSKGLWYWLTDDGSMFEGGWARINGQWYFFKNDGVMQSGVITVEGKTYYMGASTDGAMKTGEVNVAGTKYTFAEVNGDCTSEKAPAADKLFDKTGKELTPEIEVEEVAGITGEITNALPDYKEKYGNVLIAGNDAYLKVLVTDANGKPVANTAVSLTAKVEDWSINKKDFGTKGLNVQTTDANGYATFVIGTDDTEIDATSGNNALLSLTATVVATNQTYETTLAFAHVDAGYVNVLNNNYKDDDLLEVPSTNYSTTPTCNVETTTSLGKKYVEYVFSQQVNDKGSNANKVEIEIDPMIVIPVMSDEVVSDYYQEINKEIKEYSVYEDGTTASFRIDNIPKGLLYATLNVSSTDISAYTQVNFKLYQESDDKLVSAYTKKGAWTQKDFGYDIPVQDADENTDLYMIVEVISEGQVNNNQNAGLTIKDIEGVYDTEQIKDVASEHLTDCITWSVVKNKYSDTRELTQTEAESYIIGYDKKYTAAGNKYTYQVPVFPYTGNAILTVTDANNDVVGYFTIPTENPYKNGKYQNENVLVSDKAILVSENEAFDNVGTIETDGNKVIVNSDKSGITALQAKLELPGFEGEIDVTNNTLYTSVQWAPVLNEVESNDFYALTGQNIVVTAQLVDNQGNPVSGNQDAITFTCDNATIGVDGEVIKDTKGVSTGVTVVSKDTQTNAKGQAVLKLNSGDATALLESLEAKTSKYNVVLTIGGESVEKANLRWVEPGLSFTTAPKTAYNDNGVSTTNSEWLVVDTFDNTIDKLTDANKEKFEKALAKETGKEWIFGYEVIGVTQENAKDTTANIDVLAIEGLKVDISKNAKGDLVTEGMPNGVAKVSSTEKGGTKLKGTINKDSIVSGTDVYFYVDLDKDGVIDSNEKFKNVGEEGTVSFDKSLELPITWGIVGQQLELVSPKGKNFAVATGDQVYVKLGDAFGDAISGKGVEVTVTYTTKTGSFKTKLDGTTVDDSASAITVTTSDKGLIPITLRTDSDIKYVTITAKYENVTLSDNVITYKEVSAADSTDFALVNAVYTVPTAGQPAVIEAVFNHAVDTGSISKEMFSIDGAVIDKVAVDSTDNNKVKITLANETKELSADKEYTLAVDLTKEVDGITYSVCDSNGKSLKDVADDNSSDKSAEVSFTTVSKGTKVTATYTNGTGIKVTSTNMMTNHTNAIVVYTGTKNYRNGISTTTLTSGTAIISTSVDGAWDGDITIYYNGGSVTLTKDELNKVDAKKAQDDMKAAYDTKMTTALSNLNTLNNPAKFSGYVFLSSKGVAGDFANYYAQSVTIKSDSGIFDEAVYDISLESDGNGGFKQDNNGNYVIVPEKDGNKDLKLKTTVSANATAIIEVTYAHVDYSSVTKTVTYKVTTDADGKLSFAEAE